MLRPQQSRVAEQVQSPLENQQAGLVHAQGAHERMLAQALDDLLAARNDAGLAGADELVAAEQDHVGPGLDGLPDRRFMRQAELLEVKQRPGAQVVDQQQAPLARQPGQLRQAPVLR